MARRRLRIQRTKWALEHQGSLQATLAEYHQACTLKPQAKNYKRDHDNLARRLGMK